VVDLRFCFVFYNSATYFGLFRLFVSDQSKYPKQTFLKVVMWLFFYLPLSMLKCRRYPSFTVNYLVFIFYFLLIWWVNHSYYLPILFIFWLVSVPFLRFGSIETPKHAVSILNRNNRNKRLVSDSVETSFGSIFGCFESKLVS
jgi:hypothetical protein